MRTEKKCMVCGQFFGGERVDKTKDVLAVYQFILEKRLGRKEICQR